MSKALTQEEFINRATVVHNGIYDYSKVVYVKNSEKVIIGCSVHGDFHLKPADHFAGQGCRLCGIDRRVKGRTLTLKEFISRAEVLHAHKYIYDKVIIHNSRSKVIITCPVHGDFEQSAMVHLTGHACMKCVKDKASVDLRSNSEEFIVKAIARHGNKYNYDKVKYIRSIYKVIITCLVHGDFLQTPSDHLHGYGCPNCVHRTSKAEEEIAEYLREHFNVITGDRRMLNGKELDIVVPEIKIAIEYNGSYYHSEKFNKSSQYSLLAKKTACDAIGYKLIHIADYEDINVVKKTLAHITGISKKRVFARNCEFKICSPTAAIQFLNSNHLQGAVRGCWFGALYHEGVIVCLMAISRVSSERGSSDSSKYELRRFASSLRVVGGASKLLKNFITSTEECKSIISYSDTRWFTGNMYEKLGFVLIKISGPDYKYVKFNTVEPKHRFKRSSLEKREDFDFREEESEHENCLRNGWYRVWDCGKRKWELTL